jgi:hypothetical protein
MLTMSSFERALQQITGESSSYTDYINSNYELKQLIDKKDQKTLISRFVKQGFEGVRMSTITHAIRKGCLDYAKIIYLNKRVLKDDGKALLEETYITSVLATFYSKLNSPIFNLTDVLTTFFKKAPYGLDKESSDLIEWMATLLSYTVKGKEQGPDVIYDSKADRSNMLLVTKDILHYLQPSKHGYYPPLRDYNGDDYDVLETLKSKYFMSDEAKKVGSPQRMFLTLCLAACYDKQPYASALASFAAFQKRLGTSIDDKAYWTHLHESTMDRFVRMFIEKDESAHDTLAYFAADHLPLLLFLIGYAKKKKSLSSVLGLAIPLYLVFERNVTEQDVEKVCAAMREDMKTGVEIYNAVLANNRFWKKNRPAAWIWGGSLPNPYYIDESKDTNWRKVIKCFGKVQQN